jgi:protein-tyrosine-phosphatase
MSHRAKAGDPYEVLFLCTGNSGRSIMAEAILNRIGPPRFQAHSAGSQPKDAVHPETLRLLQRLGYDTSQLRAKSWDAFTDGTRFDHIVTVCNDAAREVCPIVPGKAAGTHWDVPNPAAVRGTQTEIEAAFRKAYDTLFERIAAFVRQ